MRSIHWDEKKTMIKNRNIACSGITPHGFLHLQNLLNTDVTPMHNPDTTLFCNLRHNIGMNLLDIQRYVSLMTTGTFASYFDLNKHKCFHNQFFHVTTPSPHHHNFLHAESIPFHFETHITDVQTLPHQAIGPPNLYLLHGNFCTPFNCHWSKRCGLLWEKGCQKVLTCYEFAKLSSNSNSI